MTVTNFDLALDFDLHFTEVDKSKDGKHQGHAHADFDFGFDTDQIAIGKGWKASVTSIVVRIDPSKSWIVAGQQTEALRRHEQGHFDITALGAREIESRVAALEGKTGDDIKAKIRAAKAALQAEINAMNVAYDKATTNGLDKSAQGRWEASINAAKVNPRGTVADAQP